MKHRISNINIGVELRKAINKARTELNILSSDINLIVDKICEVKNIEKTASRHKQYIILSEYTGIKCFVERKKKNGSVKRRKKRRIIKSKIEKIDFYKSKEWRRARYQALQLHGRKCQQHINPFFHWQ